MDVIDNLMPAFTAGQHPTMSQAAAGVHLIAITAVFGIVGNWPFQIRRIRMLGIISIGMAGFASYGKQQLNSR